MLVLVCALVPVVASAGSPMSGTAHAGDASRGWRGEWRSATTGHHGPLRARLRPTTDGGYQALFAGRFAVVVPFVYRANLEPTGYPGQYMSVKRLPLMGEYRMQATITPRGFHATYQSGKDQGVFQMGR